MKRNHRSKFTGALLLVAVSVALRLVAVPLHAEKYAAAVAGAATPTALCVIPGIHREFLAKVPPNFLLPAPGDKLGVHLLAEYGAVLVAGDGVIVPPRSMLTGEKEVGEFQAGLQISGEEYKLQTAAARSLAAAQVEAQQQGLSISPNNVDAAARSYQDTVALWLSRVEPALKHWTEQGRLSEEAAAQLRSLPPREQTLAIIALEQRGMLFGPGCAKSILSSVAPPGASHHLALLAFDVKEHGKPAVRRVLERHGWYQTVVRDAPHFTYLGVPKSRLESLGLAIVRDGDREYWKPRPASPLPMEAGSFPAKEVFGYSVEGRPLLAYIFGHGPNVTMIFGAFHNNEPASSAVVEALRRYLATRPQEWVGRTIIVVPQTNPDGECSRVRWNSHGVDLNRNFPGTWSVVPVEARYNPGPAPASEPETQAIMRLVEKYAPTKIVSIHQPFRCLNWDGEAGRRLADEMKVQNNYPIVPDIGYPTPGSFGSFCARKGIAMVTLEMPGTDFAACWRQNRNALLAAIRINVSLSDRQYMPPAAEATATIFVPASRNLQLCPSFLSLRHDLNSLFDY